MEVKAVYQKIMEVKEHGVKDNIAQVEDIHIRLVQVVVEREKWTVVGVVELGKLLVLIVKEVVLFRQILNVHLARERELLMQADMTMYY